MQQNPLLSGLYSCLRCNFAKLISSDRLFIQKQQILSKILFSADIEETFSGLIAWINTKPQKVSARQNVSGNFVDNSARNSGNKSDINLWQMCVIFSLKIMTKVCDFYSFF